MKKHIIIFSLILISVIGCEAINKLTQFHFDYREDVTIPSSSVINFPIDVFTPDIESNSESTFESNNTNKDLIQSIKLTELKLTHKEPTNGDLDFLSSIEVYLSAEGLPEIRIAWKDNVPQNVGKELDLDVSEEDLQEYVKKDKMKLRVKTVTDETFNQSQKIEVYTKFFVDAEILGV